MASATSRTGAHHGPQRFLDANTVDRAKQIEKLPLDVAQEANQSRRQPSANGRALEVVNRVQADGSAELVLQRRRANSGISTAYSKASTSTMAVSAATLSSLPVIFVINASSLRAYRDRRSTIVTGERMQLAGTQTPTCRARGVTRPFEPADDSECDRDTRDTARSPEHRPRRPVPPGIPDPARDGRPPGSASSARVRCR